LRLLTVPTGAAVFVTEILPVVAVGGTVAFSCVEDTRVTVVAATPLNLTVAPVANPFPLIVTLVPYGPLVGLKLVTDNVGVKLLGLHGLGLQLAVLAVPAAVVTEIAPPADGIPFGTVALI
jgi:hypothetical protein